MRRAGETFAHYTIETLLGEGGMGQVYRAFDTKLHRRVAFQDVVEELKLGKQITPRGLRRTFNDLARAAHVNDLVTRSISGHLTAQSQRHYSTVNGQEQRDALGKVLALVGGSPASNGRGGEYGGEYRSPSGEDTKKAG